MYFVASKNGMKEYQGVIKGIWSKGNETFWGFLRCYCLHPAFCLNITFDVRDLDLLDVRNYVGCKQSWTSLALIIDEKFCRPIIHVDTIYKKTPILDSRAKLFRFLQRHSLRELLVMHYVHFVQVIVFEDCLMFVKKVTSLGNVIV